MRTLYFCPVVSIFLGAPFQATAAMLLAGEVTAAAWLPTCDVISARQWSYLVSARQTVHLPG